VNSTDIEVGRIAGAFGVHGELKCDPSGPGRTVIAAGAELLCTRGDARLPVRLSAVRSHKGRLLVHLQGVDDADTAATYAGATLYAPRAAIQLNAGEYFDEDLVGCEVLGADGTAYGTVERVEHYPSSDMLVVGGRMVPMVGAIIASIDLERRRITIDPPAGLME
jgi:16S rRNA processing protein RimM